MMAASLSTGGEPLTKKAGYSATPHDTTLQDFGEMLTKAQMIRSIYWKKLNVVQLLLHSRTCNQHARTPIGGAF